MKQFSLQKVFFIFAGLVVIALLSWYLMRENMLKEGANLMFKNNAGLYILPVLPYAYDALEPYIDAQTMEIHYTKHHQAYINKLNDALAKYPEWQKVSLEDILKRLNELPEDIRLTVRNNGGGHSNHTFFWQCMTSNARKEPSGQLLEDIVKKFGSFDDFKKKFDEAAVTVFGSGWAWLVKDKNGDIKIIATHNQDSPVSQGLVPLLALDVWEHAYYLKYQNRRPEYVSSWWNVVNWDFVEQNYKA